MLGLFFFAKYTCCIMESQCVYFKGGFDMILFMILCTMLILLTMLSILVIGATGAVGIVLFGDVIVCIILIVWIIKKMIKRKRR